MEYTGINTLVAVGTGTAAVTPDVAELTIRLEALAATPAVALGKVTEASQAVLAAVRDHGVLDADLRTHGISVHPPMNPYGGQITGYQASHMLRIRLPRISMAPAVIDTVTDAAGDTLRLEGFQLSSSDLTAARSGAAASAVADARSRAEQLAAAAGVRLGPVVSIVEDLASSYSYPVPLSYGQPRFAATSAEAAMPVQVGTDEITARVTVAFQIIG